MNFAFVAMTKPISLHAAGATLTVVRPFIPPVTGVNGCSSPVANTFDASGNFRGRDRAWSASKRARTELDAVYDLSQQFPPLSQPDRPALDMNSIKSLMVSAAAVAGDVIKLCDEPTTSPELKAVTMMLIALMRAMEGVVEQGLVPLSSTVSVAGRGFAATAKRQINPPTAAPKPPAPGTKELMDALDAAEKESVVFGANLGALPVANRAVLNTNFSVDLLRKTEEKVNSGSGELVESTRQVEDALACVEKSNFLAQDRKNISTGETLRTLPTAPSPQCR